MRAALPGRPSRVAPALLAALCACTLGLPLRGEDAPAPARLVRGRAGLDARLEPIGPVPPLTGWRPVTLRFCVTNTGTEPLPGAPSDLLARGEPGTWLAWYPAQGPVREAVVMESRIPIASRPIPPGASVTVKVRALLRGVQKYPYYGFSVWINGKSESDPIADGQVGRPWMVRGPAEEPAPPGDVKAVRVLYYAGLAALLPLAAVLCVAGRRRPTDLLLWGALAAAALCY